jgi:hypothetical protein
MDNKIILELVVKNLEEIKLLVESLQNNEKADPLLIEITVTKAKLLYQELMLLSSEGSEIAEKDQVTSSDETFISDTDIEDDSTPENIIIPEVSSFSDDETENNVPSETLDKDEILYSPETETEEIELSEIPFIEADIVINLTQPTEGTVIIKEVETESFQNPEPDILEKEAAPITKIQETNMVAEQFINESSVNEKIAASHKHESKVKGLPVTNIMNAIGINDRFQFTRELFLNDSKKFDETVNHLDHLNNFLEAIDFLEANFKWTKNEASLKFMDLLKRRFEN